MSGFRVFLFFWKLIGDRFRMEPTSAINGEAMVSKRFSLVFIVLLSCMSLDGQAFQATKMKDVFRPLYMVVGSKAIYIVDE